MNSYSTNILVSIAPFLLLLVLWFVLLRRMQAGKRTVNSPFGMTQEMATSDVVAELRSLRQSVEALRVDIKAIEERLGR
jgi:hypothetical protein